MQEVLVVLLIVVKVPVVILTCLVVGDRIVGRGVAALEVLLTVSDGHGELPGDDW